MSWRERAQKVVEKVIARVGLDDAKALRKALREAYPFGERKYYPYDVWLDEIKIQTGAKRRSGKRNLLARRAERKWLEIHGQGRLFEDVLPCSETESKKVRDRRLFWKGDRVKWTSQSLGCKKTKVGTVIAIVPAGEHPEKFIPEGFRCGYAMGFGQPRDHESYLVQVDGQGTTLYWPRVSHLKGGSLGIK